MLQCHPLSFETRCCASDNPFDRFAIEPFGAARKASGRVVQDEVD